MMAITRSNTMGLSEVTDCACTGRDQATATVNMHTIASIRASVSLPDTKEEIEVWRLPNIEQGNTVDDGIMLALLQLDE